MYERELAALGEPPPVLIVVCPNTVVSKLVFDWIAGWTKSGRPASESRASLTLLSNVEDGEWTTPAADDHRRLCPAGVRRALEG